jgi:hypothetical protein
LWLHQDTSLAVTQQAEYRMCVWMCVRLNGQLVYDGLRQRLARKDFNTEIFQTLRDCITVNYANNDGINDKSF